MAGLFVGDFNTGSWKTAIVRILNFESLQWSLLQREVSVRINY